MDRRDKQVSLDYEPPAVQDLGTLAEITRTNSNPSFTESGTGSNNKT